LFKTGSGLAARVRATAVRHDQESRRTPGGIIRDRPTLPTVVKLSRLNSARPSHRVGDSIEVLYLEDNPQKAKIDRLLSLWLGPLVIFDSGAVFTAVGVVVWLVTQS
jgi:hypothetical protein